MMLDMGYFTSNEEVLRSFQKKDKQCFFSNNARSNSNLATKYLKLPIRIEVAPTRNDSEKRYSRNDCFRGKRQNEIFRKDN
jgi:hypothetical protein